MTGLSADLWRVIDHLERIVASGWRQAGPEAADLRTEADGLERVGLVGVAKHVRAVADVATRGDSLLRLALALSACRLAAASLGDSPLPAGDWRPLLSDPRRDKRRRESVERLIPLGRVSVEGGERWACLRLGGGRALAWFLLEPSERLRIRREPGVASGLPFPPWFFEAGGHLRWQARHPLFGGSEVDECRLEDAAWVTDEGGAPRRNTTVLAPIGMALQGQQLPPLLYGSPLQCYSLDASDADAYLWPGPSARGVAAALSTRPAWALTWSARGLTVPLALFTPSPRSPTAIRLVHLEPAVASEEIELGPSAFAPLP